MEVPLLRALTKEDVIVYFDKHFAAKSPHRRKLCTMVYADKASDVEKGIKRRSKRAVEGQVFEATVDFLLQILAGG